MVNALPVDTRISGVSMGVAGSAAATSVAITAPAPSAAAAPAPAPSGGSAGARPQPIDLGFSDTAAAGAVLFTPSLKPRTLRTLNPVTCANASTFVYFDAPPPLRSPSYGRGTCLRCA